jgi:PAS domain S-box-containing protein
MKLWQRILFIGLIGTVPLFVVSVLMVNMAYRNASNFSIQEEYGIAFERPLENLLASLPHYEETVREALAGDDAAKADLVQQQKQIDAAMADLAAKYNGDLGRALRFTNTELALRGRDSARLSNLQSDWNNLKTASLADAAGGTVVRAMVEIIRTMIVHSGDLSNLILDNELDSYYLVDISLITLPRTQQLLGDISLQVGDWLRHGEAGAHKDEIASMAALLRQDNLDRIVASAQTALREDKNFHGISPSLQTNLPPAVDQFKDACGALLQELDDIAAGNDIPVDEFEDAGWDAQLKSISLWETSTDELEQLLKIRLAIIKKDHLWDYAVIFATLLVVAVAMSFLVHKLLAAQHAEMQRSEERFRRLIEKAPTAIRISRHGEAIYVNQKFLDMFGYDREDELVGHPIIEQWSPEFRAQIADYARKRLVGEPAPSEYEGLVLHRDGSTFTVHVAATVVNLPDGEANMAFLTDIRDRQQLEDQLRQSQKMEGIGQLAGGVAHDFNNILATIIMQTELVAMTEGLPGEVEEGLRQVLTYAERAAALTRQLLLFSRRQVMQQRDLDLNETVTDLVKMLQRIIGEDVRLQLNLHPKPLITHADPGMLDQVLMNLAINARDAMPGGGRLIIETSEKMVDEEMLHVYPDLVPGRFAWLSVTDTGGGIPADILPRIFEPFFTTKEAGKGTGLGLATVFGIVRQHQGWIKVYSEMGEGTNFQIFFPATDATPEAITRVAARPKPRGGTETILLVEDDESVRLLTRMVLEKAGYHLLEAGDGPEALKIWDGAVGKIDLLLTDIVMPGMSGRDLAVRLQEKKPGLKVIFASGYSSEMAGRELALQPGQNFIQKPCSPSELLELVRRSLDS